MNCREIQDLLTPYLLGDLEPAQAEDVRAHLQTCDLCRNSVEDLQATLQLLREGLADTSAVPPQLPEKFILQFKKLRWRRPQVVKPKPVARRWWVRTAEYAAVAAVIAILAGLMLPNLSKVSHYQSVRGTFEQGEMLLCQPPPGTPPPAMQSIRLSDNYAADTDEVATKNVAEASTMSTARQADVSRRRMKTGASSGYSQPSAGKEEYASAAPARSDKPGAELRLTESESAERKEESPKSLQFAALSSAKQDTYNLSANMTRPSGPPPPKMPTKAIAEKSVVAYGGKVAMKSTVADSTMASAKQTASTRLTVNAPSAYIQLQPSVPVVAPAIGAVDVKVSTDMGAKIANAEIKRLVGVREFQKGWSVSGGTANGSGGGGAAGGYAHGGGKAVRAKFTIFQAKYQDGDWNCNPDALNNLMIQIRAWSKDRIDAQIVPEVLDIGTDRLFTTKPPFLYMTGSRGINLRDNEVRNMRDYLMLGGAIWVDSANPGKGNLFDLSVRREMKRVLPDRDFEIVPPNYEMYNSFFDNIGQPPGWANSREPTEMINFAGKLAVLYTPNNYGKLWTYRLDKDGRIDTALSPQAPEAESQPASGSAPYKLVTDELVRNAYKFGINVVVHLLTRYQRDFMLLPKVLPSNSNAPVARNTPAVSNTPPVSGTPTNTIPAPEPAVSNVPPVTVPVCRATGVNPFVSAAVKPFSTFSIDVDTASYSLSRNYLLRGQLPPPEAVRTEEFVNYFDYDYTPPNGPTFAVYTDCGPSTFGRGMSLLKIGVKGRRLGREEKRTAVLTLLIDTSGSMATPDRIELIKSALTQLVERLDPADKVAIVQYDSHARLLLEHTLASDKKRILAVIEGLQTSGSTALEEGMREAYATAARGFNSAACNRVMLLSDGMANLGTTAAEDILKSVASYRKQGITLSVFGFGLGAYNDVMLETLANKGDGVYSFIDSPAEAKRVLVDDLAATINLIARDVKIQVEFNPKRVKQYRQLGYENRQLKKEEFRDDSVDAGEIGSGQSVTALYELELQGDSHEPLGIVRVRCRNALTGQIEEIEQPIAPASGTTPFETMDVRFRLAAATAEFSEILRGSPFAAGSRFEDVARVLRPIALELSLDNRIQEMLRLTQTGLTPKFQKAETP